MKHGLEDSRRWTAAPSRPTAASDGLPEPPAPARPRASDAPCATPLTNPGCDSRARFSQRFQDRRINQSTRNGRDQCRNPFRGGQREEGQFGFVGQHRTQLESRPESKGLKQKRQTQKTSTAMQQKTHHQPTRKAKKTPRTAMTKAATSTSASRQERSSS